MKVLSSLDQPFEAEIALIDVGDIPLSGIKANLADADDYERAGLERSFSLNTLTFVVETNRNGQPIIHMRSVERISDPFLQLLIDLAWSQGQIYREYDVLLDPPDYQLIRHHTRQLHERKQERPKFSEQLRDVGEVSLRSQDKQTSNKSTGMTDASIIPSVPILMQSSTTLKSYLSAVQDNPNPVQPGTSHLEGIGAALKAQMDVTMQAVDSLRESNALLKEQLQTMHSQNTDLQGQLKRRDAQMKRMQAQIKLLMQRQGISGQVSASNDMHDHGYGWLWFLLFMAGLGGGGYLAWRKWGTPELMKTYHEAYVAFIAKMNKRFERKETTSSEKTERNVKESSSPKLSQDDVGFFAESPKLETDETVKEAPHEQVLEKEVQSTVSEEPESSVQISADQEVQHVSHLPDEPKIQEHAVSEDKVETDEHLIDFESVVSENVTAIETPTTPNTDSLSLISEPQSDHVVSIEPTIEASPAKPIKSQSALNTLLTLAQTYIDMGDTAAAEESLKEVIEHGSKHQQETAEKLLNQIKK